MIVGDHSIRMRYVTSDGSMADARLTVPTGPRKKLDAYEDP